MIARPRAYLIYCTKSFDGRAKCYIECYPQQKWDVKQAGTDGKYVELSRENVSVVIPREDFDKYWNEVGLNEAN